jgi:3-dehydroquinate dehydratase/shikimate dehydrogenase
MSLIIASAHGEVPTAACGADMFELRIDSMDVEQAISSIPDLLRQATLPVVLTCRSTREGGSFEGNEEDRVAMYTAALSCDNPPRYIDIEHEVLLQHPLLLDSLPIGESSVILSWHDTKGRPKDLLQRAAAIQDVANIDVVKMVWRARSLRDNLEAFELLHSRQQPMIAFCVGEYGVMSRVLTPKFGGFATFACTEEHEPTAAGQITAQELESTYRFRSINRATQVYGVIGNTVAHSQGPTFHNAAFEAAGTNAVYLPLQIPSGWEHLKATTMELIDHASLDFSGASVTIPHKQDMLKLVVEKEGNLDDLCTAAGATNTLQIQEGVMSTTNTDVEALVSLVSEAKNVLVLGAGGVARAAVVAMKSFGASVCIAARNTDQANELARELSCEVASEQLDNIDTVINCTPVGMFGSEDPEGDPVLQLAPTLALLESMCVVEFVYAPRQTPLLKRSEEIGCRTVNGDALFQAQAVLQQTFWSAT